MFADDVLSSPVAYPQLNWENDDPFERKDEFPDFTLNFEPTTRHTPSTLPLPIFEETPKTKPTIPIQGPYEIPFKNPMPKKNLNPVKLTKIFHPFENSISTEITVKALRNQIMAAKKKAF